MAEIDIERKRRPSWIPWFLATLLLVAVVGTAWYLAGPGGGRFGTDADIDTLQMYEREPPAGPGRP